MTMTTPTTFMLLLRGGVSREELSPQQFQRQIETYMNWINALKSKGHFLGGQPLEDAGKVLSGKNGQTITDGPFTESKEAVGGYFLLSARDLAAALELAKGCPILGNGGTVEVRSIEETPGGG